MADLEITQVDFTRGIAVKNLVVPPMLANVVISNAPPELVKAFAKEKLVQQKVAAAAFEALKKSSAEIQKAIKEFDAGIGAKPPATPKEAEERAKTFNTVCKQIAEAQCGVAIKAATNEWQTQQKKVKDLQMFRIVFAAKTTLNAISIAASITTAALSMGTLAVTLVGTAKTVASLVADIYNFARDIAKAEKDIVETDLLLSKAWSNPKLDWKKGTREMTAALGVPFVKSIGGLETLLKEHNAKNGKKDEVAEKLYAKAKELMAGIERAPGKLPADKQKKLEELGAKTTELLNQIHGLSEASKSNDLFNATYGARLKAYKEMRGAKLGGAATATPILTLLAGLASTSKSVVEIALKLA
jgi:hypothetical protein